MSGCQWFWEKRKSDINFLGWAMSRYDLLRTKRNPKVLEHSCKEWEARMLSKEQVTDCTKELRQGICGNTNSLSIFWRPDQSPLHTSQHSESNLVPLLYIQWEADRSLVLFVGKSSGSFTIWDQSVKTSPPPLHHSDQMNWQTFFLFLPLITSIALCFRPYY